MNIAVTAASGQLGSAIIRQLVHELGKEHVIGIARTPAKATHHDIEVRKGDYNSREDFELALEGMDAVVIISSNGNPPDRVGQHRNIIEAAKSQGVKKIVYTSIQGDAQGNTFSPVVSSNRQTEEDIRNSSLQWAIGRNSLYIEPDLEYLEHYVKDGEIANCAGEGKCTYTSRPELAYAYARMVQEDKHNGQTYNLLGPGITQAELTDLINHAFGTSLTYRSMSVEEYLAERKAALGEGLGTIIGGIYAGIRSGAFDGKSDFEQAAGRPHKSAEEMIQDFRTS